MKKLILLFGLISLMIMACAQQTPYNELPVISTISSGDGVTLVRGGEPFQSTVGVMQDPITDTLEVFRDSLDSYDTRIDAAGGAGNWDRAGTILSPLVSGDDVLLSAGEHLQLGDSDQRFEPAIGELDLYIGDDVLINFGSGSIQIFDEMIPDTDNSVDLGSESRAYKEIWNYGTWFKETTVPSPGVNTGTIWMDNADEKVYFTNNSTTYDLTGVGSDTVSLSNIAPLLVDTVSGFVFGLGAGNTGDSATFQIGAYLGADNEHQDSLIPRIWTLDLKGESGDSIVVALYYDESAFDDGSPTTIKTGVGVGVDGGTVTVTSFDISIFGPGYYWAEITALPGTRPKYLIAPFKCSRKRN